MCDGVRGRAPVQRPLELLQVDLDAEFCVWLTLPLPGEVRALAAVSGIALSFWAMGLSLWPHLCGSFATQLFRLVRKWLDGC